jgi:hypothetical protein
VVDLWDEPIENMTADALEVYVGVGDAYPHAEDWRMYLVRHHSVVPHYMTSVRNTLTSGTDRGCRDVDLPSTQLARRYSNPRKNRHEFCVRLDLPSNTPWIVLRDRWVTEYIVARRHFYDTGIIDEDRERLSSLWEQNESIDWSDLGDRRNRLDMFDLLKSRKIEPMVHIRVSKVRQIYLLMWNAELRAPSGIVRANVLAAIFGDEMYFEKLYTEEP